MAASYNASPETRAFVEQNPIAPGRHSVSARAAVERRTVQIPDVQADPEYAYAVQDVGPIRTVLAVPMLKGDDLVGVITIYKLEVKPFTDKQIALVETFADQAVIAIENVRLFKEVEARNAELRVALEQQTATGEILRVISQLPHGRAARLRRDRAERPPALRGHLQRRLSCRRGTADARSRGRCGCGRDRRHARAYPRPVARDTTSGRAILDRRVVHLEDSWLDSEYTHPLRDTIALRSILTVPHLPGGDCPSAR